MISKKLPRRTGLSADAGPGKGFEWTPGGRGREAEARELGAGRQERSACLTTGLPGYSQGCSPRNVRLEQQKLSKKLIKLLRSVREDFIFCARGLIFEGFKQVIGGHPCGFYEG